MKGGKEPNKTVSSSPGKLLVIPKGSYRKIAQKNWGLTDKQMKGMHVHHRIPQSEGGTNDPANLYVCSPSCHSMWHGYSYFVEWATENGKKTSREVQRANGIKVGNSRTRKELKKMWEASVQKRSVPIVLTHLETGTEINFPSRNAACRELGLSPGSISRVLRGEQESHRGYSARY